MDSYFTHNIAPSLVIRGKDAWSRGQHLISGICDRPLLIGRSCSTSDLRNQLLKTLQERGIKPLSAEIKYDCCEEDLSLLTSIALQNSCNGIIAAGGGKVLDTGKLLGYRLHLPVITVPLSASTCAGWTSISNIYSSKGSFRRDVLLDRCPDLLIFDHGFVRLAPKRTLASGMADALAKWYESSVSSSSSNDFLVQQSVQMARVLRDQLFINGQKAFENSETEEWIGIVESCSLTAGLIGGIGGAKCRTAAAHAVHNALTQIDASKTSLHGEKVGLGILIQLKLEERLGGNNLAKQSSEQLLKFLKGLELPTNLSELGFNHLSNNQLLEICSYACRAESEIHYLPFKVSEYDLHHALISLDKELICRIIPNL